MSTNTFSVEQNERLLQDDFKFAKTDGSRKHFVEFAGEIYPQKTVSAKDGTLKKVNCHVPLLIRIRKDNANGQPPPTRFACYVDLPKAEKYGLIVNKKAIDTEGGYLSVDKAAGSPPEVKLQNAFPDAGKLVEWLGLLFASCDPLLCPSFDTRMKMVARSYSLRRPISADKRTLEYISTPKKSIFRGVIVGVHPNHNNNNNNNSAHGSSVVKWQVPIEIDVNPPDHETAPVVTIPLPPDSSPTLISFCDAATFLSEGRIHNNNSALSKWSWERNWNVQLLELLESLERLFDASFPLIKRERSDERVEIPTPSFRLPCA